ncbi:MAG: hypothetical protein PHQ40_19170 [Anaerolineaceae bacterium]|nr:hypothetical protein [Anaerolineaceae bacterium]
MSTQAVPLTRSGNPWTTGVPTQGSGYGPGMGPSECEAITPAPSGQGNSPWTTGTPTPGSGYGLDPELDPMRTCTPSSGNGPGPRLTQSGPLPTQGARATSMAGGHQPTTAPGGPGRQH